MSTKKPTIELITPPFRMSYPHVVTAKEFVDRGVKTGKFAFQVEAIFAEAELTRFRFLKEDNTVELVDIRQVLAGLSQQAWPNEDPAALFQRQGGTGWPLIKGEAAKQKAEIKGKNGDHYIGNRIMSLKSNKSDKNQPPRLGWVTSPNAWKPLDRNSETDMQRAVSLFQGGNYAFAAIAIVADTVAGRNFLTPYLNEIRYVKEGQKFGNQGAMARFDGISGGRSDYDPTKGMSSGTVMDL